MQEKALYYEKSETTKVCSNPDLQRNPNGTDRNHRYLACCILALNYNVITPKPVLFFAILLLTFHLLFSIKITIKGYSIEKLIHKINEIQKIHQKKYSLGVLSLLFSRINIIFCFSLLMLIYLT
jgi:hypothetical protein